MGKLIKELGRLFFDQKYQICRQPRSLIILKTTIINVSNSQHGQICGYLKPESGAINEYNRSFHKPENLPRFALHRNLGYECST